MGLLEDLVNLSKTPLGEHLEGLAKDGLAALFGGELGVINKYAQKAYKYRSLITSKTGGLKILDLTRALETKKDENGNIIDVVVNAWKGLTGFLSGAWQGISKGAVWLFGLPNTKGGYWQLLTTQSVQLLYFDWNQSDEVINKKVEANMVAAANAAGEAVGYFVCGGANLGASVMIPKIGKLVASRALGHFTEEVWGQVKGSVKQMAGLMAKSIGLLAFKSVRAWIKSWAPWLPQEWGVNLMMWGQGNKPWTIAGEIKKAIAAIPNKILEGFAEGAFEGCIEGFVETGYIVGNEIDMVLAAQKAKQKEVTRTIEVNLVAPVQTGGVVVEDDPSQRRLEERLLVKVHDTDVRATVVQAINTHILLGDKDLGLIIGQPAEDYVASTIKRRQLTLNFKKGKQSPPWKVAGKVAGQVTVTIPEPKVGLSWNTIKNACRHWTWGKFKAEALLKSGRKVTVNAATADEATDVVKRLISELCSEDYYAINVTEERERNVQVKKSPIEVYPATACLLVRRPSTDLTGKIDISGQRWEETPTRFPLWTETAPAGLPPLN